MMLRVDKRWSYYHNVVIVETNRTFGFVGGEDDPEVLSFRADVLRHAERLEPDYKEEYEKAKR